VADEQKPAPVDREEAIALIGKHARKLATLARELGCPTLSHMLQIAGEQAERELTAPRGDGESGVS
jgi:hypothetical protein